MLQYECEKKCYDLQPPLMKTTYAGFTNVVKILFAFKVDPNMQDCELNNVLHIAAIEAKPDQWFLIFTKIKQTQNVIILYTGLKCIVNDIIDLLLDTNVDINIRNGPVGQSNWTAWDEAMYQFKGNKSRDAAIYKLKGQRQSKYYEKCWRYWCLQWQPTMTQNCTKIIVMAGINIKIVKICLQNK